MKKSEQLFFLIKKLSKSEKRYFKIFCFNKDEGNNYLRLFNTIEAQKEYDERKILRKFHAEKFGKQLHVTKNYLSKLILSSLRSYHQKSSKETEVYIILRNVQLLFEKELFDMCEDEIHRAEKIISRYEFLGQELELINWKRKLSLLKKNLTDPSVHPLIDKEKRLLELKIQTNQYWEALSSVFQFAEDKENNFLKKEFFQKESENLNLKVMRNTLLYIYNVINSNPDVGLQHVESSISLLEEQPHRIKEDPEVYHSNLNNKMSFLIRLRRYDEVGGILEKIRSANSIYDIKESNLTVRMMIRSYNVELEMLRDLKKYKEAILLISTINDYLESRANAIPTEYQILFYFQFTSIFFRAKEYKKALLWVQKLMEIKTDKSRLELQAYGRLLNLMIHFELGNTMVLKYAIEHTRRFLKKHRKKEKFEDIMLRFFSKIAKSPISEYPLLMENLQNKIFHSGETIVTTDILDSIDIKSWLEDKLQYQASRK